MASINKMIRKETETPLWIWALALCILTFAVFSNTLSYGFLENWDDPFYISNNAYIQGFTWTNLKAVFTKEFVGNYAPLHLLSYMIDYEIWGLSPKGFHLANVLWHMFNAVLVFILLFRVCKNRFASFAGALIFAIHPVQAESVAWVTERKNILGMSFLLLAFLFYQNFLNMHRRSHYLAAFIFFLAGLLAKSVVVILPPILLLYELTMRSPRDRAKKIIVRISPFVLAAAGISVLTVMTQERGGGIRHLYGEGVYAHVLTVVSIHLKYLQLIFFPVGLSAVYDLPIQTTVLSLRILAAVITFGILITIFLRLYLNKSRVCFWILFYFIALLPVSHIIPIVTQMNDRYLYYPMVAVSGMIAHALSYFWRDGKGRWQKAVGVVPAVVFLLIGVLAFSTYERNRVWKNGFTLWTAAMTKDPDFASPHAALGEIYMHKKVLDQAERELLKSIELDPKQLMPYINLSAVYYQMKRWGDAAIYAEKGFAIEPNNAQVRSNLGAAYKELGRFEEALSHLKRALQMDPDNDGISYNLALVYYETSRFAEAARILEGILRKTPYKLAVLVLLSVNYEKLGKDWKTEEVYLSAIKAKPDHHLLSYNLACFYATHGKPEKAIFHLTEALRKGMHDPDLLIKDPDMNSLRERSDFKEILTRMTTPPPRPF